MTPDEVSAMAAYYRIDLSKDSEFHLLAVAMEGASAPVLFPWEERVDHSGHPYFYHVYRHVRSNRHPLDNKFLNLVNQLREAGPPEGVEGRTVLAMDSGDGTTVYYDFKTNAQVEGTPAEDTLIPPLPTELLPRYDATDLMQTRRRIDVDAVKKLTFFSWWSESMVEEGSYGDGETTGGKLERKFVTVTFHLETGKFEVEMQGAEDIHLAELTSVTLDRVHDEGNGIECWDLYVGAPVHILGKRTTLHQASAETLEFLEFHADKLRKAKARFLDVIPKYRTKPLPPALRFEKGARTKGGTSIRALMMQVGYLREELAKYRPSLAEKISPLE